MYVVVFSPHIYINRMHSIKCITKTFYNCCFGCYTRFVLCCFRNCEVLFSQSLKCIVVDIVAEIIAVAALSDTQKDVNIVNPERFGVTFCCSHISLCCRSVTPVILDSMPSCSRRWRRLATTLRRWSTSSGGRRCSRVLRRGLLATTIPAL
jgi:hypothetical protein